jgi:hypothetical protein
VSGAVRMAIVAAASLLVQAACTGGATDESSIARGRGLAVASLSPAAEAAVFRAAVRAAFDVGPDLVLELHPLRLPRTAGMAGGDSVPAALVTALRSAGTVRSLCDPHHDAPRDTPHCGSRQAGYIVRGSPVFRLPGDTVELYFAAEGFGPVSGTRPVALRFEKIYQVVPEGAGWRVAREARVTESP